MQIIPALIYTNERASKRFLMLACACALMCGGCITEKHGSFPTKHLAMAHPIVTQTLEVSLSDPPDISFEPAPVPRLVVPRSAPPKPRVASTSTPGPTTGEKARDAIIAPELSDEQLSAAKSDTQQSLLVAERNLGLVQGKNLNAAQQDLVSKIRGFVESAREAMKENDWQRARTHAKKAEVLSKEFAPNP
ncbi:MAG TPA: hypothetical protein VFI45_06480 [Candidatus Acidoferrum sp.]|nr:hypothetical protein [Candidatus Acidoferrum sp.]